MFGKITANVIHPSECVTLAIKLNAVRYYRQSSDRNVLTLRYRNAVSPESVIKKSTISPYLYVASISKFKPGKGISEYV